MQCHIAILSGQLDLLACIVVHGFNVHTHSVMEAVPGMGRGTSWVTVSHRMAAILPAMIGGSRV